MLPNVKKTVCSGCSRNCNETFRKQKVFLVELVHVTSLYEDSLFVLPSSPKLLLLQMWLKFRKTAYFALQF